MYARPERPPMMIALSSLLYAVDETEKPLEIGTLEEVINFELDREYQSTPLNRFEETMVSRSGQRIDLPL